MSKEPQSRDDKSQLEPAAEEEWIRLVREMVDHHQFEAPGPYSPPWPDSAVRMPWDRWVRIDNFIRITCRNLKAALQILETRSAEPASFDNALAKLKEALGGDREEADATITMLNAATRIKRLSAPSSPEPRRYQPVPFKEQERALAALKTDTELLAKLEECAELGDALNLMVPRIVSAIVTPSPDVTPIDMRGAQPVDIMIAENIVVVNGHTYGPETVIGALAMELSARRSAVAVSDEEIAALRKDRASLNSMATLLAQARRERDEAIAARSNERALSDFVSAQQEPGEDLRRAAAEAARSNEDRIAGRHAYDPASLAAPSSETALSAKGVLVRLEYVRPVTEGLDTYHVVAYRNGKTYLEFEVERDRIEMPSAITERKE